MESLDEKVAWVLGAGTGIGQGAAMALAAAGVRTVLSGRRVAPLVESAALIQDAGGEALTEPVDITDAAGTDATAEKIVGHFGRLDILVNSAGINIGARHWEDHDPRAWHELIDINVKGTMNCVAAVLPQMRSQGDGVIVNVASWASRFDSYVSGAPYTASKRAMLCLNETINMEEGRHGIRACALCPAEVATPLLDNRPVPPTAEDRARMLQPQDLAEAVVYVASLPPRVCINEILISPTWNRNYVGGAGIVPASDAG
jgi:NADP-dependent 3-hydroxy acid dehydrogenase YdfG